MRLLERQRRRAQYTRFPKTRARTVSLSKSEEHEHEVDYDLLEGSTMGLRSDTYWRIILILLFIVLCLMGAIIVCALVPKLLERPSLSKMLSDGCQSSAFKVDPKLPKEPTIFQDLTKEEIHAVRDYLITTPNLNLTRYENASLSDNFIYLIELYLPVKQEALLFINGNGSKPTRRARTILFNGAKGTVEELLVYPLPQPTRYDRLVLGDRPNPVPYSVRPFSNFEQRALQPLVRAATEASYTILRESFGYWFHNCSLRCLLYMPTGSPGTVLSGKRRSWLSFLLRVPGRSLHPVPYELYVDHTSPDSREWSIIGVAYANQFFSSINELVDKYNNNSLSKVLLVPPSEEDINRGWLYRQSYSFMNTPLRPPINFEPNGKRYSLAGRKVRYAGWEFHVGTRTSAGPAVYDVKFNGTQVTYEVSIQEVASFYSAYGPKQSSAQYLESQAKLGASFTALIKGVDCPETATFLSVDTFMDTGSTLTIDNAICIFEMDTGIPSRRHTEFRFNKEGTGVEGMWFSGGLADYALVVRSISTPFSYDQIFDFIFHQNGVIELRTSTSGYLQTTYYDLREAPFGYLQYPAVTGTIHDHFVLYKIDFDVGEQNNTLESIEVVARNVSHPWEKGTFRLQKELNRTKKRTEKESLTRYNFDKPRYHVVQNSNLRNRYGVAKGYRLQPQYLVKQLYDDDYFVTKAAAWTKYQLAVSKYKDSERFGSCIYGQYGAAFPICNFDSFFDDNDVIENEDLVTWVVVGGLHIPNAEDIPTTVTTGNHFTLYLKPFGFFDSDPTMGSTDAILTTVNEGKVTVHTFGTPVASTCPVPDRKFG